MATTAIVYSLIGRDRASGVFRQVARSATRLQSTSSKVGAAIKASFAVGAIATAGLGASVLKMAGDFEKNMNRVEALSGATGAQLEKLRNQAKDLGKSTQYGAAQSADAMAQLATAGLTVNQIYGAMPAVLSLASSEQLNLTRAAEITTNVLTGYGMTIKEIPHAVDAMVKASVKANTSVDDLGEAFKYSGPIAHQAGLQFEEAVAATALMGNAGIKASMAGTALRGAVTRLLAPTKKISTTLKDMGVNVATSDGKLRPLTQIVGDLAKKGATTGQIMTIFGQRAGPGMAALIQQGADKLAGLTKELENSGGTAEKISKIQMKGWRGEIIRLKNAWEGLMIELGDSGALSAATKALAGITGGVRNFAEWVNTTGIPAARSFGSEVVNSMPVQTLKQRVSEAKTTVADFFSGLRGKGSVDVSVAGVDKAPVMVPKSAAADVGAQMRDAFSGGLSGIDWSKIGNTIGSGLADAIESTVKNAGKLTAAFGSLLAKIDWVGIGIAIGKFVPSLLAGFIVGLLNFDFVGMLKGLASHWQEVLLAILFVAFLPAKWIAGIGKALAKIPFLGKLLSWAFGVFAKFSKWIVGWGGKILKGFGRGFMQAITRTFPGLGKFLTEGIGKIALAIVAYTGRFGERAVALVRGFGNGLIKGAEGLGKFVAKIVGPILKPFVKAGSWLFRHGKTVVVGLKNGIVAGAKGIGGFAKRWMIDPVVGAFKTAGSWLWARGSAIVTGLKNGIVSGAKAIGSFGKTWMIDPFITIFKTAGSWLWSRGGAMVSGLKNGVVSAAKGIGGFGKRWIIDPVVNAFKTAGSWLLSRGSSAVSGFKSGVVNGAKAIGKWTREKVINPVTGAFAKAGSWLLDKGSALIKGLKDGIVGSISKIGDWIKKNVIDPVVGAVKKFFGIHSPSTVFAGIGGNLVAGLMKGLATTSGGAIAKKIFGDLPRALGSIVGKGIVSISQLPGKALKALGELGGSFLDMLGIGDSVSVGKGVNRWAPMVSQVLAMLGLPGTALGPVLKRIQMESGGNPNAINLWDSNAKAGHPSQGLMQTIPSTFNAYAGPFRGRGITDPLANIYAGINYARHRYGGNWINIMTRPGGYAKGTRNGLAPFGQTAWVGEKGPELMQVTPKGTRIFSNKDSMAIAAQTGIKLPGYASGTISNAADRQRRARQRLEDAKDAVARAKRRHKGVAAAQRRLEAAQKELKAANIALSNAKRSAKTSISNTIKTGLLKTLQTGTSAQIASAVKSLATKLLNAGYDGTAASIQRKGAKLQGLADKRTSVRNQIKAANQYATDQAGNIKDFLGISGTSATSVSQLISQMTGQQKTASSFVALTKSLKSRGASKDLLAQLSEAGPGSQLATILSDRSVTTQDIAKLNKLMTSGNSLATSFGKDMADLMFDSGKDAGKGFLAGLKSQEKELTKQIDKLAKDLVAQIKKALKIKSPSVVMRDQVGKQIALGTAVGIEAGIPSVVSSAERMANSAAGISTSRVVIPSPAVAGAQQAAAVRELAAAMQASNTDGERELVGHLVLDSGELLGVIRGTVKPMIKASEGQQAYRAKVGRRP
ncbi:phage tail tape measure protein [Streptomyces chartreusis]|uniref:phage tail tape measure protein n=1 Tax=Streptomyces chartreusis TaxID=1969 RepID=UPI0038309892